MRYQNIWRKIMEKIRLMQGNPETRDLLRLLPVLKCLFIKYRHRVYLLDIGGILHVKQDSNTWHKLPFHLILSKFPRSKKQWLLFPFCENSFSFHFLIYQLNTRFNLLILNPWQLNVGWHPHSFLMIYASHTIVYSTCWHLNRKPLFLSNELHTVEFKT